MIVYRHASQRTPPWLEGWAAIAPDPGIGVVWRESPHGVLVGVGDPLLFDEPVGPWVDVGDGWEAALREPFEPRWLVRSQLWCDVADVPDMKGRGWAVPRVLKPDGRRAFRVAYGGPEFLPVLTPQQERALAVAKAAREAFEGAGDEGIDVPLACRWLSILLPITMHAPAAAFGALNLLDDRLAVLGMAEATGLRLKVEG